MNALIYTGPTGDKGYLTTESPASHYGIPVLRVEGPGVVDWPDLGRADVLPTGLTVADLVVACASGKLPPGIGGKVHRMSKATRKAAGNFLRQWPDGPQLEGWKLC